ncbi:hypothetical protein LTR62_001944 [Meristemomyces frigidus]|uniref:UFSP1/2/DUB catalytic domain-containing protein n=1 Tax=Meristemomyces frigidus TaxID=1508187 RepID=A0AAN7YKU5_9PEZI|nr:hypothetical protein LTR62_001944 [Meristemomyces frigidus]
MSLVRMAEATCPFCGISSLEPLVIETHIDEDHAEGQKFSIKYANHQLGEYSQHPSFSHQPTWDDDGHFTKCTRPGCGEYVLLNDIDEHLAVHKSLAMSEDDASSHSSTHGHSAQTTPDGQAKLHKSRNRRTESQPKTVPPTLLDYFSGKSVHGTAARRPPKSKLPPGRLGRRELGPHAFGKRMPDQVRRHLLSDAQPRQINGIGTDGKLVRRTVIENENAGLIPVLADLCSRDNGTTITYLCHPSVKHVRKLRCDGNFCGYWNIQMVLTYLRATGVLPDMRRTPHVLQIQVTIEQACDNGILAHGRNETGGLRGTRKWIGTSEAAAYFSKISIGVGAHSFEDESYELAVVSLLDHVEAHFITGLEGSETVGSPRIATRPPLYFQRLGHSMTIVGLERRVDGSRSLLVFDPSFDTLAGMRSLLRGQRSLDILLSAAWRRRVE